MGEPSFSVVIPTYNRAKLLPKTLASVFGQSHPAKEVLVVDNCSTDDTEVVLAPLIEAGKVRYIRHDKNYERARSRNTGMENATGDYVTFLDSDDLMYRDNLADAAAHVRAGHTPRFFHNLYELVDTTGKRMHLYRFPSLDEPRRAILEGNFLSCIGVFIHREIYSRLRFDTDPRLTGSEDWEFWIRVTAEFLPTRIAKVNSGIVHHGGRTVVDVNLDKLKARMELVRAKIASDEKMLRVYGKYLGRLDVGSLVYMGTVANSARRFGEARALLREAFRLDRGVVFRQSFLRPLRIALFEIDKGM
jgi:glycosyltransferase involved in cell wall biosynthesis